MKIPPMSGSIIFFLLSVCLVHAQPTLEGMLRGTLESNTYLVVNTLTIELDDTLRIEAGTELCFLEGSAFICRGLLIAEGTSTDSILFESVEMNRSWSGMTFLNPSSDNSMLSYCRISGSGSTGLTFLHAAATITHSIISRNSAGGIRCESYSNPSFSDCRIEGNVADQGGGLFATYYSFPSFTDCQISDNQSTGRGGGLYAINHAFPVLTRCRVEYNSAGTDGGGLAYNIVTWNATIDESIIAHNTAGAKGGALYCRWHAGPTIRRTQIVHNEATEGGLAVDASDSHFSLINCTVASNEGSGEAAICLHDGGGIEIRNTILFNDDTPELFCEEDGTTYDLEIAYTDLEGGEPGIVGLSQVELEWLEGNLDENPGFINPIADNFGRSFNSPCIDAGDPADPVDLDGTRADMGAIAYQQANSVTDAASEFIPRSPPALIATPNPFNSSTRITLTGIGVTGAKIRVYNLLGQLVGELTNAKGATQVSSYHFDGHQLSTGSYIVVASRGQEILAKERIHLIK